MLLETFLIEGVTYWLGFSDLIYEGFERKTNPNCPHMLHVSISGTYRWQESYQLVEYANWGEGEPSNSSLQNCGWKTYGKRPGWHDAICSQYDVEGFGQIHALCEADK